MAETLSLNQFEPNEPLVSMYKLTATIINFTRQA